MQRAIVENNRPPRKEKFITSLNSSAIRIT